VFDYGNLTCYQKVTVIVKNPNIEIRAKLPAGINTKQCQNPNVLNSKQKVCASRKVENTLPILAKPLVVFLLLVIAIACRSVDKLGKRTAQILFK
jgi:hypothetical protein